MPILKPSKCCNCPFYNKSKYIVPDSIVEGSKILILAQSPGENEELGKEILRYEYNYKREPVIKEVLPQPLIGATGLTLKNEFWPLTKLPYSSVSRANIIKCRPNNVNELPAIGSTKAVNGITNKMLKEAIEYCTTHYLKIPSTTKYILAMGSISLYHLTGEIKIETDELDEKGNIKYKKEGITEWRGSVIGTDLLGTFYGMKEYYEVSNAELNIFPTLHLASLYKSEKYYHATLLDFVRFGNLVRGTWPKPLPEIKVNEIPSYIPNTIGFDTEYDPNDNNKLIMWSLADIYSSIYVVDSSYSRVLSHLPSKLNLITQNGLVDLPHFLPLIKDTDLHKINMEDCMLAHATLWTGEPNSLDYMLSKYGLYNRHKHLRTAKDKYQQYLYAGLDADTTLNHVWKALIQEFKVDPISYTEYKKRRQPLLYIINRFQNRGVKLNQERIALISQLLNQELQEIESRARELTANPDFNIASSQQVSKGVYEDIYTTDATEDTRSINKTVKRVRNKAVSKLDKPKKGISKKKIESIIAKLELTLGS
jgi:uracil-DNA glycosylase